MSTRKMRPDIRFIVGRFWIRFSTLFERRWIKPLVEIGFMPKALSTHPEPYRHDFPRTPVSDIYTGWAYPPKDYQKWSELVFQFVRHLRERYGDAEVKRGCGKYGMNLISDTGKEHPKNISSSTTSPSRPSCARFPRRGSEDRIPPVQATPKPQTFCGLSRALRAPEKLRERQSRIASRLHQLSSQGISELARRPRADGH